MFQRLFLTVCISLTVTALNGKQLHKKFNFVRDDIPSACEDDRVKCQNSDRCIPQRWVCDGDNDCGDLSDETNCPPVTCSDGRAKCPTANRCVPSFSLCDGVNDCGDNSDEPEECRSRTCPEGQLKCKSGQCVDFDSYCTGSDSCRDGTFFTDITCPSITCDPGYVKCAVKTKCISTSYVCDGDNDCGDLTDEPDNCRDRSCESDFFKCNNGQCLNETAFCLFLSTYGCRDETDTSSLCADFTCPTGYTKCTSDGKCTANTNLCDGSSDCADGSDEAPHHCTAPLQCTSPDTAPCPGPRRCINTRYFCDSDNDCGDNSDEDASLCSTRTCQPNEVRCVTGQCIDKDSFCDGTYNCRDGSLSDKSEICSYDGLNSNSNPQMPTAEEIMCISALRSMGQCDDNPFPELSLNPNHEGASLWNKLVETDLRDLCSTTRTWFECYQNTLSACANVENPMLTEYKLLMSIVETVINYVCVQHLEVFNRNKACLLEKAEGGNNNRVELKLNNSLEVCKPDADPFNRNPVCISEQFHGCVKDIVARQCGDEVTSALSDLAHIINSAAGCPASRRRALHSSHEQRRGFFHKKA